MKLALLFSVLFLPTYVTARTIFVDQDRSAADADGSSWIRAFSDLQSALTVARSGDRILVAEGIYMPGSEPDDTFNLVSGVSILGGFRGDETATSQRDIQAHKTILSGDLNEDDLAATADSLETGVFSAENRMDNAANIITGLRLNSDTILDGFTISGGHADGARTGVFAGGAMRLLRSSMQIRNCTFENNFANSMGGAIAAFGPDVAGEVRFPLVIENCLFQNNEANPESLGQAGALSADDFLEVVVRRSIFRHNKGKNSGAIRVSRLSGTAQSEILESRFLNNEATIAGGALEIPNGADTFFRNCSFEGNFANTRGGALEMRGEVLIQLFNCAFQGNSATIDGGGAISSAQSELALMNCSFQGNRSRNGGALRISSSTVELSNSVIWNNADRSGTGGFGASIEFGDLSTSPTSPRYRNNLIQHWDGTSAEAQAASNSSGNFDGTAAGNNPLFITEVDPEMAPTLGGNLSIPADSFLVDRGLDSLNSAKFDVALNLRKVETIDLGAHEFQKLEYLWLMDDDGDGVVFGMEQAIGTPPYFPDNGNGKRLAIDETRALTFGVNPDASPRTLWSIVRSTNLDGFSTVVFGPSTTPPQSPFIDPNPPVGQKAFYQLQIDLAP